MRAVRTFWVVGLIALAALTPSRAAERVDLLLVLAADISRSVEHGIAGPVIISGWSAGGHLTAFLLDHRKGGGGLAISGVLELAPLRDSPHVNDTDYDPGSSEKAVS